MIYASLGLNLIILSMYIRPGKLDFLFLIHQILCLYAGGQSFFIIHYIVIYSKIVKIGKIEAPVRNVRIMKVEAVVLKPMQAGMRNK